MTTMEDSTATIIPTGEESSSSSSHTDDGNSSTESRTSGPHRNTFGGTDDIASPFVNNDDLDAITTVDEPWLRNSSVSTTTTTTNACNRSLSHVSSTSSSGNSVWPNWPRPCDDEDDSDGSTLSRGKRHGSRFSPTPPKKVWYRSFQVLSIIISVFGAYVLVLNVISLTRSIPESTEIILLNDTLPSPSIRELLKTWVIQEEANSPRSRALLDIPDFRFVLNNVSVCAPKQRSPRGIGIRAPRYPYDPDKPYQPGEGVYFMILVHSAPHHFAERQAIRSTWGSVKTLKNWAIRLVFLLGTDTPPSDAAVRKSVFRESFLFGDIVSGNFHDTYRNLTYKHIMGYRWALTYCPGATFILKTDDDAFIDIFQLFEFTTKTYGFKPEETLVCNVFPEGTKPVRDESESSSMIIGNNNNASIMEAGKKWLVTREEYPHDKYPKYCGGLAYLITPDILERIVRVSERSRFFWIDDVYVTGVLRELVEKEPFYLNLRYSYEPEEYRKWLTDRKPRKIPFMIVHVERGSKFSKEMNHMWRKTMRVWS